MSDIRTRFNRRLTARGERRSFGVRSNRLLGGILALHLFPPL